MAPRYDYGQQYRLSLGGPLTPAVKGLLIASVAIFILELFVAGNELAWAAMLDWFALNPILVFTRGFLWQLVTYMFLHDSSGPFHILFNMLVLWMLGCEVERVWGSRRFLWYYILCGAGGGLMNCAFALKSQTIGASGAIFGVITAYAMVFPTRTILFWMIFPMTARQFALLMAAIELVSLRAFSPDGVAHFAHLGGALTGYLLIKGLWDPRRWHPRVLLGELRWWLRRRRFKTIDRENPPRRDRDRFYPYH